MRILWLAGPGFRALAQIRGDAFRAVGAEVMIVSSRRRFSRFSGPAREFETVLRGKPVPWADWRPCYQTYRAAKNFGADVVVTEFLGDPRWMTFTGSTPRINVVHDAEPHDDNHKMPLWHRLAFDRWNSRADATLVFSEHVASTLRAQGKTASPLRVAPLHSDLAPSLVPDYVQAHERKNFIMVGRQEPYKNHAVIFDAWDAHVRSDSWRGDELLIYGGGEITQPLPSHAHWKRGDYDYKDVVGEFAQAKGSIVHHTEGASQSGVQLLSMLLGVPTLVSRGGGLPEYQPDGMNLTDINDAAGLARAISALAGSTREVEVQSRTVLEHYKENFDVDKFVQRFLGIAEEVVGRRSH